MRRGRRSIKWGMAQLQQPATIEADWRRAEQAMDVLSEECEEPGHGIDFWRNVVLQQEGVQLNVMVSQQYSKQLEVALQQVEFLLFCFSR